MDELDSSIVYRNLESKIKIAGLEALDLLIVLIISAMMSFIFDGSKLGAIFVLIIPFVLLIFLYFIKRNKPERYLGKLLRFYQLQGRFSASSLPKNENELLTRICKGENNNEAK